jgi:hypothetical protein
VRAPRFAYDVRFVFCVVLFRLLLVGGGGERRERRNLDHARDQFRARGGVEKRARNSDVCIV